MAKITDQMVKTLPAPYKGNTVTYDDEVTGFGIRVTAKGARSFVLRYVYNDPSARRRSNEYRYTIGEYPTWSVNAARAEAKDWRRRIEAMQGHPMAEKTSRREATKQRNEAETYKEAVEDYITREQEGRRGNATAFEVKRTLLKDGAQWLDDPVAEITAKEIRKRLETMRDGNKDTKARPYLANRMHAYLAGFFRWASEPGIEKVTRNPMLGLRRPWEGEEARDRYFNDDELKAIWKASDTIGGVQGAFLKVLMLTGKRRGALSAMRWSEISPDWVWSPPTDPRRRKRNKRVHVTPLPPLCQRVLSPLKPKDDQMLGTGYVFAGSRRGTHFDAGSQFQAKVRDKSGIKDFFQHALRHTVETRLAELGVQPHIRDMVLDHAPLRGSGGGYDHHSYEKEMREALEAWADHIERQVSPGGVKVLR